MKSKVIFDNYTLYENATIKKNKTNKEIKQHLKKDGFIYVLINGKYMVLHKIMLLYFNNEYNSQTDKIVFIDNNKSNCQLSNLKVIKNGFIRVKPNEEMRLYYEKYEDELYIRARMIFYKHIKPRLKKNTLLYDDVIQYLLIAVWNRLPQFFIKFRHSDLDFMAWAYVLMRFESQNQKIYKFFDSYSGIIRVEESFDNIYDLSGSFVGLKNATIENIYFTERKY